MTFELRFTDKEITAWGGMGLMKRMLEHMEFDAALSQSGLPQRGKPYTLQERPAHVSAVYILCAGDY